MPDKVNIPISVFEYAADYVRPVMSIWMDRAVLVQAMFDAFQKWKLDVNDVEPITTGKPSEQGIKIKLPEVRISFFFGPASCKFVRDGVDWATVGETIEILAIALDTLTKSGEVKLRNQKTVVALHIQPKTKTFIEILNPFLSPDIKALRSGEIKTGASIVKWDKGKITLDGSGIIANAIYLRLEHEFDVETSFEEMAGVIRKEEDALFVLLGIEDDSQ
jgi:hypothetical protein